MYTKKNKRDRSRAGVDRTEGGCVQKNGAMHIVETFIILFFFLPVRTVKRKKKEGKQPRRY